MTAAKPRGNYSIPAPRNFFDFRPRRQAAMLRP
jgi:hypothetical protein